MRQSQNTVLNLFAIRLKIVGTKSCNVQSCPGLCQRYHFPNDSYRAAKIHTPMAGVGRSEPLIIG